MNFAQAKSRELVTRVTAKSEGRAYKSGMARQRRYYVYMLASKSRVFYVGVTGALMSRVLRHKAGGGGVFTRKYRVNRLVWFQASNMLGTPLLGSRR